MIMKLQSYEEQEATKKEAWAKDDLETVHRCWWHRYLSGMVKGPEIDTATDNYVSFEIYELWLRRYPGWSQGVLSPRHAAWRPEYYMTDLPMNLHIKKALGVSKTSSQAPKGWLRFWLQSIRMRDRSISVAKMPV